MGLVRRAFGVKGELLVQPTVNEPGAVFQSFTIAQNDPNFSGDDTREGLTSIVSVKHPAPQFESQTKVKLMNPEVQTYVTQVVGETFIRLFEEEAASLAPVDFLAQGTVYPDVIESATGNNCVSDI
mgnify:CR=1 FL=1